MRTAGIIVVVIIALMATALIVSLFLRPETGIDWSDPKVPRIAGLAAIATLLASTLLRRQRISTTLLSLTAWAGFFAVIVLGYSYRDDLSGVWNRMRAELFAGQFVETAGGDIRVARAGDNHFYITGAVNNATVTFVIDTGASSVALSWADARAAGLNPAMLEFNQKVETASGTAKVAPVRIARLAIGSIERRNISAVVLPEGVNGSLLGLGFLDTLKSYEISGDHLTLHD